MKSIPFHLAMLAIRLPQTCSIASGNPLQTVGRPLARRILVSSWLYTALKWWGDPDRLRVGIPFPLPPPNVVITTGTSKFGWGAHLRVVQVSGVWSRSQQRCLISLLEFFGSVLLALRKFKRQIIGQSVFIESDSISVETYLNRQGGTCSPSLCR